MWLEVHTFATLSGMIICYSTRGVHKCSPGVLRGKHLSVLPGVSNPFTLEVECTVGNRNEYRVVILVVLVVVEVKDSV